MECIRHVQKRVGSRKLKNQSKGVKLTDGKGLAGKGRLTDSKIDVLQNYYGLAVRENLSDVGKVARPLKHHCTMLHQQMRIHSIISVLMERTVGVAIKGDGAHFLFEDFK